MSLAKPSLSPQRLLLAAILLGLAAGPARAELFPIRLGDEAALSADLGAEFRYDDNIYLTNLVREADFVATAIPGLMLDVGKTGATRLHAETRMQFVRYLENQDEDDSLLLFSASGQRDGAHTRLTFDGSYNQIRSNSREYQISSQLVRYDTTTARVGISHSLSARMNIDAAIALNDISFQTERFVSSRSIAVPINFHRAWTPRIGGGLQYRFNYSTYDRSDSDEFEHSIGFGTRGDFTATLSGHAGVGVAFRTGSAIDSTERFRADVSLTWRPDARTSCTLAASSDAAPSGSTGSSYENMRASLGVVREFSPRLSGRASVSHERADYTLRDDSMLTAGASLQFGYSEALVFAGDIEYEDNSSNILFYDYTRTILRVSTTYRF